jgi:acetyl esterase
MVLDPATQAFLEDMSVAEPTPLDQLSPREARGVSARLRERYGPGPDLRRVEDVKLSGPHGEFGTRILIPQDEPRAVIVYYHGGGWVLGSVDDSDTFGRALARATGAAVVMVDYRLAPENRFPVPVEDCWVGLQWAAANVEEIAGGAVPLIVAGDSAGGNLAAVVARRARDAGHPAVSLQVLIYPVVDADLETASYAEPSNQLMVDRDSMQWFWDHYVPDARRRTDPDAAPLRLADFRGLPPTVVVLAEHDVLKDEGAAYAAKLRASGVPVRERMFLGQMHGFATMVNLLPGSDSAIEYVSSEVARHLTAPAETNHTSEEMR